MIQTSDKWDELPKALHAMQSDGLFVKAWRENTGIRGGNARYANLADVVIAALAPMATNGVSYTQFIGQMRWEHSMFVTQIATRINHTSGEWMQCTGEFPMGEGPTNKEGRAVLNPNQAHGIAITYAKRLSLLSALGMLTGNDDDGQALNRSAAAADMEEQTGPPKGQFMDAPERGIQGWQELTGTWQSEPVPGQPDRVLGDLDPKKLMAVRREHSTTNAAVLASLAGGVERYLQENDVDFARMGKPPLEAPDNRWPSSFYACSVNQIWALYEAIKAEIKAQREQEEKAP